MSSFCLCLAFVVHKMRVVRPLPSLSPPGPGAASVWYKQSPNLHVNACDIAVAAELYQWSPPCQAAYISRIGLFFEQNFSECYQLYQQKTLNTSVTASSLGPRTPWYFNSLLLFRCLSIFEDLGLWTFGTMEVTPHSPPISTLWTSSEQMWSHFINSCRVLWETLVKDTEPGRAWSGCYN